MSAIDQERRYGAVRTALVGYGTAAYIYFLARPGFSEEVKPSAWGYAPAFVLSGLGLQVLLVLARAMIKHLARDRAIAAQAVLILEIIADGITVLLFAVATMTAIGSAPEQL